MNKDLDIHHYSYEDICGLFKITDIHDIRLDKMREKCNKIKEIYPGTISSFYEKAYKIIECVHQQNDTINIDIFMDNIKKIPHFETKHASFLIQNIKDVQKKEYPIPIPVPTPPIVYTAPQSAAPGSLNSLKRMTQMRNLNLNSCFRHNYYDSCSTDYDYILPSEIKNVISLRLASLELPNSWYLFSRSQKNHSFIIRVQKGNKETEHIIEIPDGNYDNESLTEYINTNYLYESGSTNGLQYIKMNIPDSSMKTTFEIVSGVIDSFSLHFLRTNSGENMMKTVGWILGFRLPNYEKIQECIESEGLFDGNGDRYLYVSLNDYQYNTNSTNIVGFDKSYMDEDILAKVHLVNGKLSMVMEDNQCPLTKRRIYNGPVNLRKIHVKILDAFGCIIDLNHMDFSMTLELEILYESFQFRDVTC